MRIQRLATAILTALMSFCLPANAQAGAPAEPEYVNQFFVLGSNGQLTPLEREPLHHIAKRKNIPFIKAEIEGRQDVDGGPASPVHVGPNPHFVVKMMTGAIDPTTLMHLIQLKFDKQGRYYVTSDNKGFVFTNGKSAGPQGDAAQLKISKYGQSSLEVQSVQPLPAGEYAFITSGMIADCFSVDPSIAGYVTAQPAAPAKPVAAPPPPPPTHPASTVLDVAPGAPGYPALHATEAAMEGCWWAPFVSQRYALEMLVQRCENGKGFGGVNTTFEENDLGVTVHLENSSQITQLFTVNRKPAEQTISAALKEQFIQKQKLSPARRAACRVKEDPKDPKDAGPDESYSITGPCQLLETDDAVVRSFLYIPTESRTKFLYLEFEDAWPFDQYSIRFLPD